MGQTSIEWTDRSVNPFRANDLNGHIGHHCEKISPGCANCYASRMQPRFGMPPYGGVSAGLAGKEVFFDHNRLDEVLRRKKPTKWFWWDMTDAFLDCYPDEWLDRCFAVMALTPQHTHQLLTKRPERMLKYLTFSRSTFPPSPAARSDFTARDRVRQTAFQMYLGGAKLPTPEAHNWLFSHDGASWHEYLAPWPLPNVWLGVSVENQAAKSRIDVLRTIPAAVRFLSIEPLLEDVGALDLTGVHWVIVGGESGPGARPMAADWVRSIRDQCEAARVPFFFKQWGGTNKKLAGRELEGHTWDEMPTVPA